MKNITNKLPWGQTLSEKEKIINTSDFISSISTFYIHSSFAVTDKRLVSHYPNIALWIFPLGFNNMTFNLKQISGVNIDIEYKIWKILLSGHFLTKHSSYSKAILMSW